MKSDRAKALSVLTMNTLAFSVCFACWMMYGVLITFLIDNGIFQFDKAQVGWLIGIPVLTGSLLRLPVGLLTDRYGGRLVYMVLMLLSAIPMYMVSSASSYQEFLWLGLGFGISGAAFAVGIAYTSVWFSKERQGTALGVFGIGNSGAALTSLFAPTLLLYLTHNLQHIEGWRTLPKLYAAALVLTTIVFYFFTYPKQVEQPPSSTMMGRLHSLADIRVWRFGLYYFLVFGGFVALSQWLIPYYVNVYAMSLVTAGLLATIFSLPSGLIRGIGGWMSDRWGARTVMYLVLWSCLICSLLLVVPRVVIESPGEGVMAFKKGTVTAVSPKTIEVDGKPYALVVKQGESGFPTDDEQLLVWPTLRFWQEPVVKVGDAVKKKQLLAKGLTQIYFQANVWIFTFLVFVIGIMMGVGKAAVYRHIPDYFPKEVGVVGGLVGVIGGLGGFVCPIIFGYLLKYFGLWTTCWMFFAVLSLLCLGWMHWVITHMMHRRVPQMMSQIEAEAGQIIYGLND